MVGKNGKCSTGVWSFAIRLTAVIAVFVVAVGLLPEAEGHNRTVAMRLRGRQNDYRRRIRLEESRLGEQIAQRRAAFRRSALAGNQVARIEDSDPVLRELNLELSDIRRQLANYDYFVVRERANARFWANFRGEHGEQEQRSARVMARSRGYQPGVEPLPLPPRTFMAESAEQGVASSSGESRGSGSSGKSGQTATVQ